MTAYQHKNNWRAAAFARDLPALVVMPITVAGQELVLWRSARGHVAAWANRCPHRGMRLSHGFVRGEALSCIYHGWSYGAAGQCARIPAHPDLAPPEAIRVPRYVTLESGEMIWVAETTPDAPPPELAGLSALRTVTVEGAVTALPGLSATADGTLRGIIEGVQIAVVLQPTAPAQTVLHVLTAFAPPQTLISVSAWVEMVRLQAEGVDA